MNNTRANERLQVLISVLGKGIQRVRTRMLPQLSTCDVVIAHQIPNDKEEEFSEECVAYTSSHTSGLSRNRNNALAAARDGITLIADDDLEYVSGFDRIILNAFDTHPEADIITFDTKERSSQKGVCAHTLRSIASVSSVTIAFRRERITAAGITFDERFGLGSKYPTGEENIFLKDCLDAGLILLYVPKIIVSHSHASSGYVLNETTLRGKIAAFFRMYGLPGACVAVWYFPVFKYQYYKTYMNPFRAIMVTMTMFFRIISGKELF